MVKGLDLFRDHFADYSASYVLIGGAACNMHEDIADQEPRATKDLDIVLVVEALSADFVRAFWAFVRDGGYTSRQRGEDKHEFFRFIKPADKRYPKQLELFSRSIGLMNIPEDAHLEPIPVEDELSSLSAILMNKSYYSYTISHSILQDGIHIANFEALICLKAKAYIDLRTRKEAGDTNVDHDDIDKHKKDIFRLAPMIPSGAHYDLPAEIAADMAQYFRMVADDLPNEDFLRAAGLGAMTIDGLLNVLKHAYLS